MGDGRILRDHMLSGFCVRLNPRKVTVRVATSGAGQQFRMNLGYWPLMSVEEARSRAMELASPFTKLSTVGPLPDRVQPRARVLQEADLPAWKVVVAQLGEVQRDFLYLVLYTGLRRNEARELRREQINLVAGVLSIPETKNGKPHSVSIPEVTMAQQFITYYRLSTQRQGHQVSGWRPSAPPSWHTSQEAPKRS